MLKNKSVSTLSDSYVSMLCTELMMLHNAGVAPYDSLLLMIDDEREKDGQAVLRGMLPALEDGNPLSAAFRESGYFPRYMVSMMEAGEQTGRVAEALQALSNHYARQERIAQSLRNAVLYPVMLLTLMLAVVALLIIQVLPMFNEVYLRLGTQLPPFAEQLMAFGRWVSGASVAIALTVGAILLLAFIMWLIPQARASIGGWFRDTWGDKGILGDIASSRFASALAMGVASGLDTEKALELASSVSGGSKAVDGKHKRCIELIHEGKSLADSMFETEVFSARNSRMLSLGARSGMADAALSEIAERSGRAVQDDIDRLIGKVEPTLVIISSVLTGVILLSVMLPLMGIMTALG